MSLPQNIDPLLHSGATLFIDGAFRSAISGQIKEIYCPTNGKAAALVSKAAQADSEATIDAARRAFDTRVWSSLPAGERGGFLLHVAGRLAERKEEFALAESLDTGKRIVESRLDVDDIIASFRYFGKNADSGPGRWP